MDSIKNKLEELKSLFDSKLISEMEYESLKKEILFEDNSNKQFVKDIYKDSINNEIYDFTPSKSKSNSIGVYIVIGLCVALYFAFVNSKENAIDNSVENSTNLTTETSNNDNSDSSTETSKSQYDEKELFNEGYNDYSNCLNKGIKMSNMEERAVFDTKFPDGTDEDFQKYKNGCQRAFWQSNSGENNNYNEGSDGMIYENTPCDLCRGTGYEINTAQHILGGPSRRICPMCQGKGVKSY